MVLGHLVGVWGEMRACIGWEEAAELGYRGVEVPGQSVGGGRGRLWSRGRGQEAGSWGLSSWRETGRVEFPQRLRGLLGQVGLLFRPHDNSLFLPPPPVSAGLLPAPSQARL